jgi:hypothetical protein
MLAVAQLTTRSGPRAAARIYSGTAGTAGGVQYAAAVT